MNQTEFNKKFKELKELHKAALESSSKKSKEDNELLSDYVAAHGVPYVCKFYADTHNQKNKLFHFSVKNYVQAKDLIIKALRLGFVIRAAYFNCPALKKSQKMAALSEDMALSYE